MKGISPINRNEPAWLRVEKHLQDLMRSDRVKAFENVMNNIEKHSPGYLKKLYEIDNYESPQLLKQKTLIDKKDYKCDTGKFSGQPGVLHSFGRNPRFK